MAGQGEVIRRRPTAKPGWKNASKKLACLRPMSGGACPSKNASTQQGRERKPMPPPRLLRTRQVIGSLNTRAHFAVEVSLLAQKVAAFSVLFFLVSDFHPSLGQSLKRRNNYLAAFACGPANHITLTAHPAACMSSRVFQVVQHEMNWPAILPGAVLVKRGSSAILPVWRWSRMRLVSSPVQGRLSGALTGILPAHSLAGCARSLPAAACLLPARRRREVEAKLKRR
ncbi:hypothetical protein TEQG_01164 [Trichophyton equinum CBS 127.97]|uniref:Uncharacterized protein n=1 Tax=Trichophyton equinum (strain ATCC MYA-4606 / CBS 127.97) TaxID=559882 RepID=F2PJQ7_TRIEC|nr:hypothetical protein TEQG_01164 [Trichophyton equinum CBS 127.97]